MPTTKKITRRSSRLGARMYKVPPPLKFDSVAGAQEHIKANKMKVTAHETHTRGERIHVVDKKGKTRTITIVRSSSNGNQNEE